MLIDGKGVVWPSQRQMMGSRSLGNRSVDGQHDSSGASASGAREREQVLVDSEQTLADVDETSSAPDQASAETDQLASDRDQAASDRELAAGGTDPDVHDADRDIRQHTTRQREQSAQGASGRR